MAVSPRSYGFLCSYGRHIGERLLEKLNLVRAVASEPSAFIMLEAPLPFQFFRCNLYRGAPVFVLQIETVPQYLRLAAPKESPMGATSENCCLLL